MDVGWQYKIIFLILLFLLSAFFSGSEVALFSLNKKKIKNQLDSNPLIKRYILFLLDYPRRLLVTILIGNTIVNVAASIIAVLITLEIAASGNISIDLALTIQIIALTILIIIFGELIPKVWASKNPIAYSKVIAFPLYWISVLIYPVSEFLTEIIKLVVSKVKIDKTKTAFTTDEISDLAELGHEKGTIEEEEQGLIQSIVTFQSITVGEVMTPRVDIKAIPDKTNFDELLETITSTGHSRIPLYKTALDEIVGIIYAKDLLPYIQNKELQKEIDLPKLSRRVIFIPKSKYISDLMREFQEKKTHIAIVVDEYGGTAGLITLEDIIEEIIGEIRDEYDKEENPIVKIEDNKYLILAKLSIDEVETLLDIKLIEEDEEDFETIGGFILSHAGHIPKEGYSFEHKNIKFTVKEVLNKRINKVLVEKLYKGTFH